MMAMKRVLVAGTADTKGEELAYLASMIAEAGAAPAIVDVGIGEPRGAIDVSRHVVAAYASKPFLYSRDRGEAVAAIKTEADRAAGNVLPIIAEIQKSGATTLRAIADALNARGVATPRGGRWHAMSVKNALARG